jgi:hypothetical protein
MRVGTNVGRRRKMYDMILVFWERLCGVPLIPHLLLWRTSKCFTHLFMSLCDLEVHPEVQNASAQQSSIGKC